MIVIEVDFNHLGATGRLLLADLVLHEHTPYEGKSMAGLIDLVRRREIPTASTVLYAHLGGQPAINAYASLFS